MLDEMLEKREKLKKEIMNVLTENQATIEDAAYMNEWLRREIDKGKKRLLKNKTIQEALAMDDQSSLYK